jgi:DNA (cytosine-5)-methyltransferase 1
LKRYYLDLFSGIGGFALGARWAGLKFDGHYFSEVDKYASEVYQRRFPGATALGDVTKIDYSLLPKGEWFVSGGFPCQPHSVAGKRKASEDKRDLWPECRRMLCELRPRIALFENVLGLFVSDGGGFFRGILRDIAESGSGLLPTPAAAYYPTPDTRGFTNKGSLEMLAAVAGSKDEFIQMAYRANKKKKEAVWPTPTTSEATHGSPNQHDSKGRYGLTSAVVHYSPVPIKMFGTPTANDAKNSLTESQRGRGTLTANIVENEDKIKGRLNSDWVERLMGYPDKWTDIDTEEVEAKLLYPDAWQNGTWDTIPRITSGQKHRQARLKCLGNAVVPQIPQLIWGLIEGALWS